MFIVIRENWNSAELTSNTVTFVSQFEQEAIEFVKENEEGPLIEAEKDSDLGSCKYLCGLSQIHEY